MSGFLIKFKTSLLVICLCVMYLAKLGVEPQDLIHSRQILYQYALPQLHLAFSRTTREAEVR